MPIPMISDKILASSKAVENGWSLFELMGVRASPSSDGKSVNYFWEFEAIQGPNSSEENKGRRATNCVNTAGLAAGIQQACSNYIGMLSALTGIPGADIVNETIDESVLIGKKLWADITTTIREGKTQKNFVGFSPENDIPF